MRAEPREAAMDITDIRINRVESDNTLTIIAGEFGRCVAMPSRRTRDGEFKDIAHPKTTEFCEVVPDRILEAFDKDAPDAHSAG